MKLRRWWLSLFVIGCAFASCAGDDLVARVDVADLPADASDWERAVFADGVIVLAEYEASMHQVVECVSNKGLRAEIAPDGHGAFLLSVAISTSEAKVDSVQDECSAMFQDEIEYRYLDAIGYDPS